MVNLTKPVSQVWMNNVPPDMSDIRRLMLDLVGGIDATEARASPIYTSRAAAVTGAPGLPASVTQIFVREGTALVIRSRTAFADDPLFESGARWGVVQRIDTSHLESAIDALTPAQSIITADSAAVSRNANSWTSAPARLAVVDAQISNAPVGGAASADIIVDETAQGISQTWQSVSGESYRRVRVGEVWGAWVQQSVVPGFADRVERLEASTPIARRNLDVFDAAGDQAVIAANTSIANAPPMADLGAGGRVWNVREADILVQNFEAAGLRWLRRRSGNIWSGWQAVARPPRVPDLALSAALQTAHDAAIIGRGHGAGGSLREQIVAAAALHIDVSSAPAGPVAALTPAGHWGVGLARAGASAAVMTVDGIAFGAGHLERLSATPLIEHPVPVLDVFLDFTVNATGSGAQTVLTLSTDADTRLQIALLASGAGYSRFRFELPGVTYLDNDHHYPNGDRIQLAASLDYRNGLALIWQSPMTIPVRFTPPALKALTLKRISLGAGCQLTLHEALILTRGDAR
ncbi:MAG: pyocin knob domain-containing protein [Paracoccus sp. (in: a-proteobacteria)]|nr:pyocin knob domain-containing protein [Paracoccus sp. (in: a-proteobacteria)]